MGQRARAGQRAGPSRSAPTSPSPVATRAGSRRIADALRARGARRCPRARSTLHRDGLAAPRLRPGDDRRPRRRTRPSDALDFAARPARSSSPTWCAAASRSAIARCMARPHGGPTRLPAVRRRSRRAPTRRRGADARAVPDGRRRRSPAAAPADGRRRSAAGAAASDDEVLRLGVGDDDGAGRLLGLELELLGEHARRCGRPRAARRASPGRRGPGHAG